jgi:cell division protein FtsQ
MRSVNARKPARSPRAKSGRRGASSASRGPAQRHVFGRRGRFRDDPVTRFARRLRDAVILRRPMILITLSVLFVAVIAGLIAGGYVGRSVAAVNRSIAGAEIAAGFGISDIRISGEHRVSVDAIRNALGFKMGQPIFSVDVGQVRSNLRKLPWVQDAEVHKHYPGSISVNVIEKLPFALWLTNQDKLFVIARSGAVIAPADGSGLGQLPHFVGDPPVGAAALVDAIASHRAVNARVRAMQRISGRRWNLLLDGGVVVDLPEQNWRKQLDDLEHLIVDKGVLERDVGEIDLRESGNYIFILRHSGGTERMPRGNSA